MGRIIKSKVTSIEEFNFIDNLYIDYSGHTKDPLMLDAHITTTKVGAKYSENSELDGSKLDSVANGFSDNGSNRVMIASKEFLPSPQTLEELKIALSEFTEEVSEYFPDLDGDKFCEYIFEQKGIMDSRYPTIRITNGITFRNKTLDELLVDCKLEMSDDLPGDTDFGGVHCIVGGVYSHEYEVKTEEVPVYKGGIRV